MRRTFIQDIGQHVGEEVEIRGWLQNKRSSGKLRFLILRDGTGYVQGVVFRKAVSEDTFQVATDLTHESSLAVTGTVRQDDRAPGGYEMDILTIDPIQIVPKEDEFPITPKEHGIEFLMDRRHLWIRSRKQRAILRIRHAVSRAAREFLDNDGFVLCDTPILTPAACEGTTNLFEVGYFDDTAFLTQSGQLYSEATAAALGKVYCFGPTFRAEKSKTRRHLTEFWMVEPEVAFATLEDIMELAERFICHIVETVLEKCPDELEILERDRSALERVVPPFPRMTYDAAIETLRANGSAIEWGQDLGGGDETILSNQHEKPVLIHRYPGSTKAFYMEPDPDRPELALCLDVLAPEGYGEIIGGGQRTANYDLLLARLEEHGLDHSVFDWYIDLRKFGSVPHSGFGMGIERVVAWLCRLDHVRETIPFPRMLYRLTP